MSEDISDRVSITPAILAAWRDEAVPRLTTALQDAGLMPDQIPDEELVEHPEKPGWLLIVVRMPNGVEVSMDVPPRHWAWADGRN